MKNFALRAGLMLACGLSLVVGIFAQSPARIPLEDFFAEPDMSSARLSPDGKHVAFLITLGTGKVGVALMDLATGKFDPLIAADDENINSFFWKGSDYIVYGGDIGGAGYHAWRSIPIQAAKPGQKRRVVALSEAYIERYNENADYMSIEDEMPLDPVHLLAFHRYDGMVLVDITSGHHTPAANFVRDPGERSARGTGFIADNKGYLRARTRLEGKKVCIDVCSDPIGRFVQVAEFPAMEGGWSLYSFGADDETLYLANSDKRDTAVLHTFNVRTRQLSAPIFQAPEGELSGPILSRDRSRLVGVVYVSDKVHYHYFDAARAKLQKMLDGALPTTNNVVVSTSLDEQTLLIRASSDRDPGTYYVLNRKLGRMGPIGKVRAALNPAQMQPMNSITYQARDGLTIHGYLTRPAGPAGQRMPLIIHPHGGPYGERDDWGFDPEVQFLANRGYAVLQVNYRGSGGYGRSFEQAGYKEWGGKMQDDLTDAVKWAIDQGIADPGRVAIYGASYGGYATLAGLVFTPELYCCGANYVGPSDLKLLVGLGNNNGSSDGNDLFYGQMLGKEKEYLTTHSPVNFIDRLRVPLFNAYGENDWRVDIKHWKYLESKLKQFNKTYEIILEENEGHGFNNEKNRLVFYRRLEAFFDRYLAPVRSGSAAASPSAAPAKSGN